MTPSIGRRFFPGEDAPVRLALLSLGAMLTLPYLVPFHYEPIGSFHAEWLAALFGLLACFGLLSPTLWLQPVVPAMVLLPLGLLAVALVQLALGIFVFPQQSELFSLYLIWAALLIVLGSALARRIGRTALCDWLASALLIGALIACVAAALSHDPLPGLQELVFSGLGQTTFHGNLAQPNHLANQLWLGLGAALYLRLRQRLGTAVGTAAIATLMAVAVLTGSRSVLAYLAAFVAMALIARWRWPGAATQSALRLTLLLIPLYAACDGATTLAAAMGWDLPSSPLAKLAGQSLGNVRLQLVRISGRAILDAPWLGHGVGSFPGLSIAFADPADLGRGFHAAEHAHNLFAEILVELGAGAALWLLVLVVLWLWRLVRHAERQQEDALPFAWILAMLAIESVHSMLEYPLWYAFFLGPTALLLGVGDVQALRLALAPRARLIVALVLFGGGVTLFSLRFDYLQLEHAVNPWAAGKQRLGTWDDLLPMVGPRQRRSLIYPYLCVTAVTRLTMPPRPIDDALRVSDCAMRVMPIDRVLYRRALVLAFAGRDAEAETTWRLALKIYPSAVEQAIAELKAMGADEAASPLLPLLRIAQSSRSSAAKESR